MGVGSTEKPEAANEPLANAIERVDICQEDDMSKAESETFINGTIPDILRWAIHYHRRMSVAGTNITLPRPPAIAVGESVTFWNGGKRFWENVTRFASGMPPFGQFENVLYAMERYPSSVLVHTGFKLLFEK
ncbi:hypothetical protein BWQ96_07560 [Gracilariopsis chorda]|uniref:Uncharacterized protein n=1 Tax=Gracilariopsis chorda TaxID=448386 RepID=A0A2V3IKY3_9FLOR|nr:hypothetical protein BWQ96_07560 [Gracilariopsis chorda]|eukprot:PXF42745.1 hypothetical protein BWQ96_07560 [Gracilariopsis chorda]